MGRKVGAVKCPCDKRPAAVGCAVAFLVSRRKSVTSNKTVAKMSRTEWSLVALLIASIFINYIDRGNLSIAAPLIEKELALSPVQIGSLLSSFFWTYALLQLLGVAGWFADRFPVMHVFTAAFVLWSGATIATGLLTGFGALYIARLCLGAGESLAYPCYSRIFATEI